jgi:hypothetical protein
MGLDTDLFNPNLQIEEYEKGELKFIGCIDRNKKIKNEHGFFRIIYDYN